MKLVLGESRRSSNSRKEAAGAPSAPCSAVPLPPIVWITPFGKTRLILKFPLSEMYTPPFSAAATATGQLSSALVAWPPSPKNPATPVPAIVVTFPERSIR